MHTCFKNHEFLHREMRSKNMQYSLKKLIISFVLLNCIVTGLSSVLIFFITRLNLNSSGVMGFFELGMIVVLSASGIIAGFKIGNLYIFIYNVFAPLINSNKIELKNQS
jgi:hypothetical protein